MKQMTLTEMTLEQLKFALVNAQKRVDEYEQLGKQMAMRVWIDLVIDIKEEIERKKAQ